MVADAGYGSEENYLYLEKAGVGKYVKYNYFDRDVKRGSEDPFNINNMKYEADQDSYICPAGRRLECLETRNVITEAGFETMEKVYIRYYPECYAGITPVFRSPLWRVIRGRWQWCPGPPCGRG